MKTIKIEYEQLDIFGKWHKISKKIIVKNLKRKETKNG